MIKKMPFMARRFIRKEKIIIKCRLTFIQDMGCYQITIINFKIKSTEMSLAKRSIWYKTMPMILGVQESNFSKDSMCLSFLDT
jgi:hypothetical protein